MKFNRVLMTFQIVSKPLPQRSNNTHAPQLKKKLIKRDRIEEVSENNIRMESLIKVFRNNRVGQQKLGKTGAILHKAKLGRCNLGRNKRQDFVEDNSFHNLRKNTKQRDRFVVLSRIWITLFSNTVDLPLVGNRAYSRLEPLPASSTCISTLFSPPASTV